MVQFLPRQPTKLENILGSLNQGVAALGQGAATLKGSMDESSTRKALSQQFGAQFGNIRDPEVRKLMVAGALETQAKQAAHAQKLAGLEQIKKTKYWEGASEAEKAIIEAEGRGDISAQLAKSLINAEREGESAKRMQDLIGSFNEPNEPARMSSGAEGSSPTMNGETTRSPRNKLEALPDSALRILLADEKLQPIAQSELDRRSEESKRAFIPQEEYIKHASKENADFLGEVGLIEKDLPNTEFALAGIEDALGGADKWAAFKDRIADVTGFEGARSAAGAELESFIKNYFLGDLTSIKGGRANVFLEKQIRDAYPKAGRDPISNQKVAIGMRLKEQINRLLVDTTRKMEKDEIDRYGYIKPGFKARARETIKKQVDAFEKKAINTIHHMNKIEESRDKIYRSYLKSGEVLMMDEEGQPYAVPKTDVQAYKDQGYIPLGTK